MDFGHFFKKLSLSTSLVFFTAILILNSNVLADTVYWTDTDKNAIFKADVSDSGTVDASSATPLIDIGATTGSEPRTVRVVGDKLVWTERKVASGGTNQIGTADLDGSNVEYIYTGNAQPDGIESFVVDTTNNVIFWDERCPNLSPSDCQKIREGDLDLTVPKLENEMDVVVNGSDGQVLGDAEGFDLGSLYVISRNSPSVNTGAIIKKYNEDGTGQQTVVPQSIGLTQILFTPLFLHIGAGFLWWTDIGKDFVVNDGTNTNDAIRRVDLDDLPLIDLSKLQTLTFPDGLVLSDPMDFFIAPDSGSLTWINRGTGEIIKGTLGSPTVTSFLTLVSGIPGARSFDVQVTPIPELPPGVFGYFILFLIGLIFWLRKTFSA